MRFWSYLIISIFLFGCSKSKEYNAGEYFKYINQAELAISTENFEKALDQYESAFTKIKKPFGKDVFNAALSGQLINNYQVRDMYLQDIINNSENLDFVKSVFVNQYMSEQEWDKLMDKRELKYDKELRAEMERIHAGDQLFRPRYDSHDDTINSIRKQNLERIIEIKDSIGFPSHQELGYSNFLRIQPHYIVLHHTAQRRSYDKSVMDLEPILRTAVESGRMDPEAAILYLNFQNDKEKDHFEVYSSWQHKHPLLPDSLNNKVWYWKLDHEQKLEANKTREKWFANSIDEIAVKAKFLRESDIPFVFTSVRKSIGLMREELDRESALEQYYAQTRDKVEQ